MEGIHFESQPIARCAKMFCDFTQSLQANAGIIPRLSHYRFLPNPFQFISCPTIGHCHYVCMKWQILGSNSKSPWSESLMSFLVRNVLHWWSTSYLLYARNTAQVINCIRKQLITWLYEKSMLFFNGVNFFCTYKTRIFLDASRNWLWWLQLYMYFFMFYVHYVYRMVTNIQCVKLFWSLPTV
jgi:hypothetical protein